MILTAPYPEELLRVARKVVWYDRLEQTLEDLRTFLTHLIIYGSSADLAIAGRYVPEVAQAVGERTGRSIHP